LGKIKILPPQKHSISYGNDHAVQLLYRFRFNFCNTWPQGSRQKIFRGVVGATEKRQKLAKNIEK